MDINKDHKAHAGKDEKVIAKKAMDAAPDKKGGQAKEAPAKDGHDKTARSKDAGKPGMSPNTEFVIKQNEHLHHDAAKEMRDQLTGAAGKDPKPMPAEDTDQDKSKAH